MEAAAAKLMDFSQAMDVPLLDQVVTTAFDASHPQVRAGVKDRRESGEHPLLTRQQMLRSTSYTCSLAGNTLLRQQTASLL